MDEGRMNAKARGGEYWEGLPNEEIMRICSHGTRIAFGILSILQEDREHFKDDPALREYIRAQIRQELGEGFEHGTNNPKIIRAWHETPNTLGIRGNYSWSRGLLHEEHMFVRSMSDDGLKLIKARSLDCRMVFTDWKGRLLGDL